MTDKLAGLAQHSVFVADSGEIALLRTLKAQDCTTNPSLILRAASRPEYARFVTSAIEWAEARESNPERRRRQSNCSLERPDGDNSRRCVIVSVYMNQGL